MSGFTKKVTFETEFDGDRIEAVFERLKKEDMKTLGPHVARAVELDRAGGEAEPGDLFRNNVEIMEVATEIVPRRLVELRGLRDADGTPLGWDDVAEEAYFAPLWADALTFLLSKSMVGGEPGKGSDPPPLGSPPGPPPETTPRSAG